MKKFYIEFCVDQIWVDDGFTMTDTKATAMLGDALPFALDGEYSARVINPASLLGSITSPVKKAAAIANGKKGGRPRKEKALV